MHIYVRKLNSVTTTEYTTTTTTTYIVQIKEDTRKGVIMHRYGKIVHAHYDKSLMGVMPRWIEERKYYQPWRPGYPY